MKKNKEPKFGIFFPRRIAEPEEMEQIENSIFEKVAEENYELWFVVMAEDVLRVSAQPTTILDVGCGPGFLSHALAAKAPQAKIYALDLSAQAVKIAKKNCQLYKNIICQQGSAENLPFANESLDLVVCRDSFHHFAKPKKVLKEMFRVLKKGGVLYLQDLRRDMPFTILKQAIPPDTVFKKLQYYSARSAYTQSELKQMACTLAFKRCKIYTRRLNNDINKKFDKILPRLKISLKSHQVLIGNK